jgi:uncharacterized membrane protein YfcA
MDESSGITSMNAWTRRNVRPLATLVLALWVAPALLLGIGVVVMLSVHNPVIALVAALAMLLVGLRVLRNRRQARPTDDSGILTQES